jgi:hypothetical protein
MIGPMMYQFWDHTAILNENDYEHKEIGIGIYSGREMDARSDGQVDTGESDGHVTHRLCKWKRLGLAFVTDRWLTWLKVYSVWQFISLHETRVSFFYFFMFYFCFVDIRRDIEGDRTVRVAPSVISILSKKRGGRTFR